MGILFKNIVVLLMPFCQVLELNDTVYSTRIREQTPYQDTDFSKIVSNMNSQTNTPICRTVLQV